MERFGRNGAKLSDGDSRLLAHALLLLCSSEALTSHWVEAAQGVEVPRGGSLLKELQIKLDITPKNRTRVRVRAGSASGITTAQQSKSAEAPREKEVKDRSQANRMQA